MPPAIQRKSKQFILGIDTGGTTIKPQLFELVGNNIRGVRGEDELSFLTEKGEWLPRKIADIVTLYATEVQEKGGQLAAIGIGSPGRFRPDGTIKPGTADNIANGDDHFNDKNLTELVQGALRDKNLEAYTDKVVLRNDGDAMMAGMLAATKSGDVKGLKDQHGNDVSAFTLNGKSVAFFGIGTGVGHAIARVDGKGDYQFVTDGHASKLRVPLDDKDRELFEAGVAHLQNRPNQSGVLTFDNGDVRAEDLFRAPMIESMAGVTDGKDIDPGNDKHAAALKFAGKYMARTIAIIKSGESRDVDENQVNGWSAEDKAAAAQTSLYLIGGGIGTSQKLGDAIIQYAQEELKQEGIDIQLVRYSGQNPAVHAAATMAKEALGLGPEGVALGKK